MLSALLGPSLSVRLITYGDGTWAVHPLPPFTPCSFTQAGRTSPGSFTHLLIFFSISVAFAPCAFLSRSSAISPPDVCCVAFTERRHARLLLPPQNIPSNPPTARTTTWTSRHFLVDANLPPHWLTGRESGVFIGPRPGPIEVDAQLQKQERAKAKTELAWDPKPERTLCPELHEHWALASCSVHSAIHCSSCRDLSNRLPTLRISI